jgi:hypothetical protein
MAAIVHPPVLINAYLAEKIEESLPDRFSDAMRFFPTQPTDINALTEQFPTAADNVFAVYDRMFRLRRGPFPYIKQEQLLYYFYKMAGDPEALIETIAIVFELLDRGDDSAQDVNEWLAIKLNTQGTTVDIKRTSYNNKNSSDPDVVDTFDAITLNNKKFLLPYFHEFKIFQLEEARDIIAFGTARTYAGNKLILNYNWHGPSPISSTQT